MYISARMVNNNVNNVIHIVHSDHQHCAVVCDGVESKSVVVAVWSYTVSCTPSSSV
jgi:hypothetical protein